MERRKMMAAALFPWVAYIGFAAMTLVIENSRLSHNSFLNWMTRGVNPVVVFACIITMWVVCRVWLGWRLPGNPALRVAGIFMAAIFEAGLAYLILAFWVVGMMGGPINPG